MSYRQNAFPLPRDLSRWQRRARQWMAVLGLWVFGSVIFGLSSMACSWLQSPQGAATVTAGVDLAVCVLNHSQEPIQQIVTDCGASTAADVIKILDAHTAAKTREAGK